MNIINKGTLSEEELETLFSVFNLVWNEKFTKRELFWIMEILLADEDIAFGDCFDIDCFRSLVNKGEISLFLNYIDKEPYIEMCINYFDYVLRLDCSFIGAVIKIDLGSGVFLGIEDQYFDFQSDDFAMPSGEEAIIFLLSK